ncbi:MAG: ABC transporter substrate-binding protein [Clostridiales bacterium]|jgi:putative ABC transport system substrate-binding protein|nr:ABC transporter substrate-binding protein [Clostridiales bacterium]
MKKLYSILSILLAMVLLIPAFTAMGEGDKPLVGILQLVEHPALDDAYRGFKDGLEAQGYKDGENIVLDHRNAQGNPDMLASIADHFISENVDLVLTIATPAAQTMAGKTETIPILGTAITDYTVARLAQSNEKPGYNVSGTTDMNDVKAQIELMVKLVPNLKKIGLLYTASEDNSTLQAQIAKDVIASMGLEVTEITVHNSNDVQQATQTMVTQCDAIYIPTDNVFASAMPVVYDVAVPAKIPVFAGDSGMVMEGGVATWGISYYDLGYQTAAMAIDVLFNGAKISEMPIQAQDKYELVINKTYCDAIGLTIPDDMLPFAREMGAAD